MTTDELQIAKELLLVIRRNANNPHFMKYMLGWALATEKALHHGRRVEE